ncbi:MAG: LutC/YkgG family protein [Acidobacteriaceae bacterium]
MPGDSREAVLASIRSAIKQSRHGFDPHPAPLERAYQRTSTLDRKKCLDRFAERLREYDAEVVFTDIDHLQEAIRNVIEGHSSPAGPPWVVAQGFPSSWLPSSASVLWEGDATLEDLNQCSGVVTACSAGIAITGTVVMQHGPGEGKRQTSLLPDRHLCIIEASQVVETVPEAFSMLAPAATRPLTFISGPSATADIEMTRIRGVHGPRHLHVIIISN